MIKKIKEWIKDWIETIKLLLTPNFNKKMEEMCEEIKEGGFEPFKSIEDYSKK